MVAVLETRKLCKSFGALTVAQNIDFRLHAGDRHALIGPNGAGKTTFVNMLLGALAPSSGRIFLGGEDVTRVRQAQRVKRGLGRTFQINTLFKHLPVLDNVALGIAGALLTQTNQFVGLNVLGLEPSGDILVMLILGGVGRLYGAFIGPVVYLIAQDYLAKQYPEYWYFGIGTLLIAVVLFAPGGILGVMDKWLPYFKQKSSARASAR